MGPQRMFGMTPWVRRLFVANLVVFLFQMTIFVDPRFLTTFGFVPLRALAQPWTFLTYMFLHGGPLHLAFNLLALYVFGPEVEERMGGGPFLGYYLLCGFGGGFLYLRVAHWRLARAERHLRRAAQPSVLVHPGRVARAGDAGLKPRRPPRDAAQAEIDRVLDKISARGIESLTPAERKFLADMSRKMRDKA